MPLRERGGGPCPERSEGTEDEALPIRTQIARALRRIVGAPDYETYVEHCRRAGHEIRLTQRQFIQEYFENKKIERCC